MIRFKYLSFPKIPLDLLDDREYILEGKEVFFKRKAYTAVQMNNRLQTFCLEEFLLPFLKTFDILPFIDLKHKEKIFTYQVINQYIKPHIDDGRILTFNYILESGNNIELPYTTFYNNLIDLNEMDRTQFELNKWHYLRVSVPHSVVGITSKRIAITCNMNSPELYKIVKEIK